MEGSGKMVVTAVGMNSQAGIIVALLGSVQDEPNQPENNGTQYGTQTDMIVFDLHWLKDPSLRLQCGSTLAFGEWSWQTF